MWWEDVSLPHNSFVTSMNTSNMGKVTLPEESKDRWLRILSSRCWSIAVTSMSKSMPLWSSALHTALRSSSEGTGVAALTLWGWIWRGLWTYFKSNDSLLLALLLRPDYRPEYDSTLGVETVTRANNVRGQATWRTFRYSVGLNPKTCRPRC